MRYIDVKPLLGKTERVVSVDALRGFNFIWILCGDSAVLALADVLQNQGGFVGSFGQALGTQMSHVEWEGFRFYDFIFPLFVFITGVGIVLSLPALVASQGRGAAYLRILRRALILYVLGLIYYGGISAHWNDIRYVGVLQRIAICYAVAAVLFINFSWRGLAVITAGLLLGYWALMTLVPVPGVGAGSFVPHANLSDWIDSKYLPGRMWDETRDPEGLLSTLPAIASCLLGVLSGLILRENALAPSQRSLILVGGGLLLVACGYLWSLQFPLIKSLWTSSFVLVTGGYSAFALGAMHQIVDVWGYKRWATVFVWIGANAIVLYMLNNLLEFYKVAERLTGGDFAQMLDSTFGDSVGWLVTSLTGLTLVILTARYLYRRKIFMRVELPTCSVDTSPRNAATVDGATLRPVRGFSDGTFSIVIEKRIVSASTLMVCVLRVTPGSAQISRRVRSGPMPARLSAAATLTLAGKPSAPSRAVPSNTFFASFNPVTLILFSTR
jgi:predicted acyltransferase